MASKVGDSLRAAADLYEERNKMYGNDYKKFGVIAHAMLGEITLRTPDDYGRFVLLFLLIMKGNRYGNNFNNLAEEGNVRKAMEDSLDDLSVYSQMLKELDDEARGRLPKEPAPTPAPATAPRGWPRLVWVMGSQGASPRIWFQAMTEEGKPVKTLAEHPITDEQAKLPLDELTKLYPAPSE